MSGNVRPLIRRTESHISASETRHAASKANDGKIYPYKTQYPTLIAQSSRVRSALVPLRISHVAGMMSDF
jgi:hypothetical protein